MTSSVQALQQQTAPRMTWWHAVVFFQFFVALTQFLLAPWYAFVMFSPGSISEYMPNEQAPSSLLILRFVIAAAVWIPIMYFTWKQKKAGLVATLIYSVALLIFLPFIISSGSGHPDFSDFLLFPIDVLLVISSVMSIRSFPKRQ
ncbi:MAG: hypothetical protein JRN20_18635 [Nitrososphaerota archaeon]|nr:hypothetical protein [Nitrososphaerota archaeon]MDG6924103.1 hypothetical protein [Nitrososphaerota archaeon]